MRRLIASVLALGIVFGGSVPAFAASSAPAPAGTSFVKAKAGGKKAGKKKGGKKGKKGGKKGGAKGKKA